MQLAFKVRVGIAAGPGIAEGFNLVDYVETRFDGTVEKRFGIYRNQCPHQIEVEPSVRRLDYAPRRGDSGEVESIDCAVFPPSDWQQVCTQLLARGWTRKRI